MNMKRQRGRGNGGKPHTQFQGHGHVPNRSQTFDSNGPDVRIRGNAYQVFEKYLALARDATAAGDRVAAENFYQHAEHYFRVINASYEGGGQRPPQPGFPQQGPSQVQPQPHDPRLAPPPAVEMRPQPPVDPGSGPQPIVGPAIATPGEGQTR